MASAASAAAAAANALLSRPAPLFAAAALLRAAMLLYGLWQDAHSPLKYTDVDYLVFTDAARLAAAGASPYARETYRYTPLLAWLLRPTAWWSLPAASSSTASASSFSSVVLSVFCFSSGKVLFALADLLAGWLVVVVLRRHYRDDDQDHHHHYSRGGEKEGDREGEGGVGGEGMSTARACRLVGACWLLNPMVATISTRGSSEGLLAAAAAALLWAALGRRPALAGALLGLAVHLKIYPFVYAPAVVWWMDAEHMGGSSSSSSSSLSPSPSSSSGSKGSSIGARAMAAAVAFVTPARVRLALASLATFAALNAVMYAAYGMPFVAHTYLHHVTRIDHRHNFSPYNVLLYLSSSPASSSASSSSFSSSSSSSSSSRGLLGALGGVESVAFVPQLLLSTVLIPLVGAKRDLPATMLAQTFAFVTFNKVCTSQYFLWYLIFLPLYLPRSSLLRRPRRGAAALALWVAAQGLWLQQAYGLEFLGRSTFVPGLWLASLAFFLVNCWLLGVVVEDLESASADDMKPSPANFTLCMYALPKRYTRATSHR
ncbi:glycosyltransferase family 50 protein [Xylariaceae sp. FL0804]|nr:glycosyltransferase family 50 protein [Xylariaceae sp. FL0804]